MTADPATLQRAASAAGSKSGKGAGSPGRIRADIQGLRALAVGMVVIYHLWPNRLTGGFVGVDVFFVISGFLITSHILSSPPVTGRDLAVFWRRRVRRLLPASLLVLGVTAVATRIVAPASRWEDTAAQIISSALYVQNWTLASGSVDYLAAENAASPVQHFWSLSVEEQFYLVWPVLFFAVFYLAARLRWSRTTSAQILVGGVFAISLAYSIYATAFTPASAYFVTPRACGSSPRAASSQRSPPRERRGRPFLGLAACLGRDRGDRGSGSPVQRQHAIPRLYRSSPGGGNGGRYLG